MAHAFRLFARENTCWPCEQGANDVLLIKDTSLLGHPKAETKSPALGAFLGSMPFCVELDNLKDTDAHIHQPAAMLVAAD